MIRARLIITGVGCVIAIGCTPPPKVAPAPPPADLVVLVPNPEGGALGAATVTAAGGGRVELTRASEGTRIVAGRAPSAAAPVADADVQRIFGAAIAARPIAPRQFMLYFETASDTLTAESRALVPQIIAEVRGRPAPDLTVIGHTDTTGDAASNVQLGLRRANAIRDLLVAGGLDSSRVDVASHGEANLLVATPDNTEEPRNRRVEVTVR
jgi:outer membrane protein OmpA-like peptidoglycan-associated protein